MTKNAKAILIGTVMSEAAGKVEELEEMEGKLRSVAQALAIDQALDAGDRDSLHALPL